MKGLALFLLAALGATAAELQVEGLPEAKVNALRQELGGRLDFILERPATAFRASDAAFLFERRLHQQGYRTTEVDWDFDAAANLIRLSVDLQTRYSWKEVLVEGAATPEESNRLRGLFLLPANERNQLGGGDPPFLPGDIDEGLSLLRADFKSRGYWEATVALLERTLAENGSVSARLQVTSGPLFSLSRPQIKGPSGIPRAELEAPIQDLIGQVADTPNLNALRFRLQKLYANAGYQFATVALQTEKKGQQLQPTLLVDSGQQFVVGQIRLEGLALTNPRRVQAQYASLPGQAYQVEAVQEIDRRLLGTGAFRSLSRQLQPQDDGTLDLLVQFEESETTSIALHGGFGTFEGLILGADYRLTNLAGELWRLTVGFEVTNRGLLGETRLTNPLFFNTPLRFDARLFGITRDNEGYTKAETGLDFHWRYDFTAAHTIDAGLHASFVTVEEDGLPASVLGPTDFADLALSLRNIWDWRNDPISPKKGSYVSWDLVLGSTLASRSAPYLRSEWELGHYRPLTEKSYLAAKIRTGLIAGSDLESDLPIDRRFFLGGPGSVRSFPQRELGPLVNNLPTGGLGHWSSSLEYIRTLVGPVQAVLFTDAGALSADMAFWEAEEIELALGAGLRLDLPIGPARLEYGHNLTQDEDDPEGAIHFTFGFEF
ncbi:MAG: BamA/TamA family outer membrane protein [Verrucomicrobiota bacterium]